MSTTLLDISKKIELHKMLILAGINRAAQRLGIPFFVVGAAARDFILQNGYNIHTPRATLDVDIGVSVSSWNQFANLITTLLTDEHYKNTTVDHRLESPTPEKTLIDILPFGQIEEPDRNILWQQDDRAMNMAGFTEAYRAALDVKISSTPPLVIKMVSIAGLALLKLLSWDDNPSERDRDVKDVKLIMYNYLEVQPADYVFDVYMDIAGIGDFELISARSLGRDIGKIAGPTVLPALKKILTRECNVQGDLQFIQQMHERSLSGEMAQGRDIELLNGVRQGIFDLV